MTSSIASSVALAKNHGQLLDVIDQLREHGVDRYVPLPQLIVCGDQSSGKSSVLEAISGFAFPTAEGCCTRFITEVVLRRDRQSSSSISIIPGKKSSEDRSDVEVLRLLGFKASCSFDDFGSMVEEAKAAMGVTSSSKAFTDDVLKIEITGPVQPHLTLVDLPGVFHSGPGSDFVKALVRSYMKSERSIILGVVSARSDLELQLVTQMIKEIDPKGLRTLGIVTKVDDIKGSPTPWLKLLQNQRIVYRLGWHALRNRDSSESHFTTEERNNVEKDFFATDVWANLPESIVGVGSLVPRLSTIQKDQIIVEIPHLIVDMEAGIADCESTLGQLGPARDTFNKQKRYLFHISTEFTALVKAAVDGIYDHTFFQQSNTSEGYEERLRAVVQNKMILFAKNMRLRGHRHEIVGKTSQSNNATNGESDEEYFLRIASKVLSMKKRKFGAFNSGAEHDNECDDPKSPVVKQTKKQAAKWDIPPEADKHHSYSSDSYGLPIQITEIDFINDVYHFMTRSRGRELPGCFNPLIIGDLFCRQSKPWKSLVDDLCKDLLKSVRQTLVLIMRFVADESTQDALFGELVEPELVALTAKLESKIRDIMRPHESSHPITYNHYFTETMQAAKREHQRKMQRQQLQKFRASPGSEFISSTVQMESILNALAPTNEADMDRYACSEAMNCMQAYYKVAMKTVIDNVATSGFENTVLDALAGIISPDTIMALEDDMIMNIAGETAASQTERKQVTEKLASLEEGRKTLQRLQYQKSSVTNGIPA